MECKIENQAIPCDIIHIYGLNFGEGHQRFPVVNYSIKVPLAMLATALSDFYEDYAQDDQIYGSENEEEVVSTLRNKGWPALLMLAGQEPELARDFVELVSYDALVASFPKGAYDKKVQYFINSIDRVELEKDHIRFSGEAHKHLDE